MCNGEEEGKKRKREEVRRQREHSSKLCNLQRPFLPIVLFTTPMTCKPSSSLTIPLTLSKYLSYPKPKTLRMSFLQTQPNTQIESTRTVTPQLSTHSNHTHPSRCRSNYPSGKALPHQNTPAFAIASQPHPTLSRYRAKQTSQVFLMVGEGYESQCYHRDFFMKSYLVPYPTHLTSEANHCSISLYISKV